MKRLLILIAALSFSVYANGTPDIDLRESATSQAAPELEFAVRLHVTLGPAYSVGKTTHGTRIIIPITGGTFEGPELKGEIIPGGADYQMVDASTGHTEVEAIYCIRTDDGVTIHVRNNGIIETGGDGTYFTCAPKFEAPADSRYAWLNHRLFVCRPDFSVPTDGINLDVWVIK